MIIKISTGKSFMEVWKFMVFFSSHHTFTFCPLFFQNIILEILRRKVCLFYYTTFILVMWEQSLYIYTELLKQITQPSFGPACHKVVLYTHIYIWWISQKMTKLRILKVFSISFLFVTGMMTHEVALEIMLSNFRKIKWKIKNKKYNIWW